MIPGHYGWERFDPSEESFLEGLEEAHEEALRDAFGRPREPQMNDPNHFGGETGNGNYGG